MININKAALIMSRQARPLQIHAVPIPAPRPHQIIVKVHAVAINPIDPAIQTHGFGLMQDFPGVLGADMAGTVHAVGSDVTHFRAGERVLACVDSSPGSDQEKPWWEGSFRLYAPTHHKLVAKIPDSMTFTNACVLPIGVATAATALFDKNCMGLNLPAIGAKSLHKTVVIWGGSSSVGACGIMMAVAAGYDVVATCSARNFDFCKSLGTTAVFDYHTHTIVDDLVEYLDDKDGVGIFDAIIDADTVSMCNEIAHKAKGIKQVGTVVPPSVPMPGGLPVDVTTTHNHCTWARDNEVGEAIFNNWLPEALRNGSMQCKPEANVVGHGLESIQEAIDIYSKGVSAKKIVVQITE